MPTTHRAGRNLIDEALSRLFFFGLGHAPRRFLSKLSCALSGAEQPRSSLAVGELLGCQTPHSISQRVGSRLCFAEFVRIGRQSVRPYQLWSSGRPDKKRGKKPPVQVTVNEPCQKPHFFFFHSIRFFVHPSCSVKLFLAQNQTVMRSWLPLSRPCWENLGQCASAPECGTELLFSCLAALRCWALTPALAP